MFAALPLLHALAPGGRGARVVSAAFELRREFCHLRGLCGLEIGQRLFHRVLDAVALFGDGAAQTVE